MIKLLFSTLRQHSPATRISLSSATTPFFEFDSVGWRKYKTIIQHRIVDAHRLLRRRRCSTTTTTDDEGRWRRRQCPMCGAYSYCECNVRRQLPYWDRPRRSLSPSFIPPSSSTGDLQTLSRASGNVACLSSMLASQHTTIPVRQSASDGTYFHFRRAVDDCLNSTSTPLLSYTSHR